LIDFDTGIVLMYERTGDMNTKEKMIWIGCLAASFVLVFALSLATSRKPQLSSSAESASAISTPRPVTIWSHSGLTDEMTGKSYAFSTVQSRNTVNFDFPYQGEQRATLSIRTKHPRHGNDVILTIERGQFLAGVDSVKVLARFDEGASVTFWANGPADHGTTALFISNYAKFVGLMRKANVVRLQTPIYQQGAPVFEFQVERFDGGRDEQ
jgi:hypothetical protein